MRTTMISGMNREMGRTGRVVGCIGMTCRLILIGPRFARCPSWSLKRFVGGPQPAIPLEFAWGTDLVTDANTLQHDGQELETVTEGVPVGHGLASHGYAGPQGPLRCGFAGATRMGRHALGASYYGVMEMSGNLWEQCVSTNAGGLTFVPNLGDGELSSQGYHDVNGWPGTTAGIYRGGGWNSGILTGFRDLAVSDRFYAGSELTSRRSTSGGRGVR